MKTPERELQSVERVVALATTRLLRRSIFVLLALAASSVFPVSIASADCERNIGGSWVLHQSNPLDVHFYGMTETNGTIQGQAKYAQARWIFGTVSGIKDGDHINMRVHWNYDTIGGGQWGDGVYDGQISYAGDATGINYETLHPNVKVNWFTSPFPCKVLSTPSKMAITATNQKSVPNIFAPGSGAAQPSKPIVHIGRNHPDVPDVPASPPADNPAPPASTGSYPSSWPPQSPPQSPPAQDALSGAWQGKVGYAFQQNGNSFSWWSDELQESALGSIDGDILTVSWTGPNGNGGMNGQIVGRDINGRATRIQWSNGQTWFRLNQIETFAQ